MLIQHCCMYYIIELLPSFFGIKFYNLVFEKIHIRESVKQNQAILAYVLGMVCLYVGKQTPTLLQIISLYSISVRVLKYANTPVQINILKQQKSHIGIGLPTENNWQFIEFRMVLTLKCKSSIYHVSMTMEVFLRWNMFT